MIQLAKIHQSQAFDGEQFNNLEPTLNIGKPFKMTHKPTIDELPQIDAVLISHDHYDHLDYQAIQELDAKTKLFVVPLGVKGHLQHWFVNRGDKEDTVANTLSWCRNLGGGYHLVQVKDLTNAVYRGAVGAIPLAFLCLSRCFLRGIRFSIKLNPKISLKIRQIPSSLLFFTNKLNKTVVKFYQGDILLAMSGAEVIFRALR